MCCHPFPVSGRLIISWYLFVLADRLGAISCCTLCLDLFTAEVEICTVLHTRLVTIPTFYRRYDSRRSIAIRSVAWHPVRPVPLEACSRFIQVLQKPLTGIHTSTQYNTLKSNGTLIEYCVEWLIAHICKGLAVIWLEEWEEGINSTLVEAAEGRTAHNNGWNGTNGMAFKHLETAFH